MVFELSEELAFPNPSLAEDDGLLAMGGDLSPKRLLLAYRYGIFPWYGYKNEPILWWCPKQRFVIFPDEIHISHSMRQMLRSDRYTVTVNKAFDKVIEWCGKADGRNKHAGAWLGGDMLEAYKEMNRLEYALSVEVWIDAATLGDNERYADVYVDENGKALVGGLYGIMLTSIGNAKAKYNFFGESMFSLAPSASKLALIYVAVMMENSGGLIDCQFETPHLKSMGGRHISYEEYMEYLMGEVPPL